MKTITQIADEIGVSRQAVHKKIKQEPLSTSLQGFTVNTGKGLQVDVDGENMIKQAFFKNELSTCQPIEVVSAVDKLIASLQGQVNALTEQNKDLREQLNQERQHSREQADKIIEQSEKIILFADKAQKLTENAQKLHALENTKLQISEDSNPPKKKSFLNRFFGGSADG